MKKIRIILLIFAFSILLFIPLAMAELCGNAVTIQVDLSLGVGIPIDPEPTSPDSDPDLHINSFDLREIGGNYTKEVIKTLYRGQSFEVEGRLEVENQSSQEARDVDSDYRIESVRDFDDQDTKIDEDNPFDIDPGEREEKKMSPVKISISQDGQRVTVSSGSMSKNFTPLAGFQKIYFFADVEEPGGDQDISSESDKDEYAKVELTILKPNYLPVGNIDSATCEYAQGWVKDPDADIPIRIHIYKGDSLGGNKIFAESITANIYREDVGWHGFYWVIPEQYKNESAYTLFFYAINYPQGDNPQIGNFIYGCALDYPVYRFYNSLAMRHFYTISESEKNKLVSDSTWKLEGIVFYAFKSFRADLAPIYRLLNAKEHFYTRSTSERDKLIPLGWKYEGIAFYAFSNQVAESVPVFRLYNPITDKHFFTKSVTEKEKVISWGWRYEGVAWYVFP